MDEARERSRRVFPHAATEIGSQMGGAALSESLGQQTFVTVLACWRRLNKVSGTNGSWTLRWREMDSNFQYAGAVNLFVAPFVVPGCLKSPPATRSRRKRQGPFQGLRVPRHPAQEDVVGGSAGTAPHDLPVASVRCLYCFCPSHFASVGEHRSYAVKRSGGYIRNHRPSEQRRLSRLRQRPGRSAGCRSDPSNRARQKARQPASPRPRTRSSNPVPSSKQSVSR